MIATAINKVLELAKVETLDIDGREFTSRQVFPIEPKTIQPLGVHTLTAVRDFFSGDVEVNADVAPNVVVIHVVDPYTVKVLNGVASGNHRVRECFLRAERIHEEFEFGQWFRQEEMIIRLMTLFERTPALQDVIRVVSGLVTSAEIQVNDDGVSQDVATRKGVQRIENVTIENPIMLAPIRTFTEVEQVESPYVLRVRCKNAEPEIAIFEAGGGQWKNEAIARIKQWLSVQIPEAKILG